MKNLKLPDEEYKNVVAHIVDYMEDKHDLQLGQFEAEFFLDELVKKIAPLFYNQGLNKAMDVIHNNVLTLEELLDLEKEV
ncbi:DUF2164 domain-containing protein [Enterobacter sp. R1(2018)]|uniref:DUF2164 domain-containing protein n=1 Tax=Enterobacter sp. R1(2018) TaxID=2447891 RepID=UPI000EB44D07|nr:DUF2164 family protein [Enterobacter sp. R1(2018)]RKQ38594.1 DUF2164 family protein [Enterobacter sp. R1(2018)]